MARSRKSPIKGFIILAAAVAGGAYFGDDLKEKFNSVVGGMGKK
jgi:hypothetical protein